MNLRLAALFGRDPCDLRTSAELLALRGVHPTVEAAEAELIAVRDTERPSRPGRRRPLRVWVHSIRRLLVFGGFLSPPKRERPHGFLAWARTVGTVLIGVAGRVITSVLLLTLMALMAWGCESHTRQLSRQAMALYATRNPSSTGPITAARAWIGGGARQIFSGLAVTVSILVPIGFLIYAVHVRDTAGLNWQSGLGALVAVSLVIAMAVRGSRR
jgi:hypothetical protein